MNKISVKINIWIGVLALIAASIMGGIYVSTGNVITIFDETKFVGHIFNSDGSINMDRTPEILALITGWTAIIGSIFIAVGVGISAKGMSSPEKKEHKKIFSTLSSGLAIGLISAIMLVIFAPKTDTTWDDMHGEMLFWGVVIGIIIGAILALSGAIKALGANKAKSKSIVKEMPVEEPAEISKDEF